MPRPVARKGAKLRRAAPAGRSRARPREVCRDGRARKRKSPVPGGESASGRGAERRVRFRASANRRAVKPGRPSRARWRVGRVSRPRRACSRLFALVRALRRRRRILKEKNRTMTRRGPARGKPSAMVGSRPEASRQPSASRPRERQRGPSFARVWRRACGGVCVAACAWRRAFGVAWCGYKGGGAGGTKPGDSRRAVGGRSRPREGQRPGMPAERARTRRKGLGAYLGGNGAAMAL